MSNLELFDEDLLDNPSARVPVCLVLDTSYSMSGKPIDELNRGVKMFMEEVLADEMASLSAEIAIVTFGGGVRKEVEFASIEKQSVPYLTTSGNTPMGEAVNLALDMLEARKKTYASLGISYYQPWMVLMTDGAPTDDISLAARRTSDLIKNKKLTIFPIGIGDKAHMETLQQFSPNLPPVRLKGLHFKEFFMWLSQSITMKSRSTPGEDIKALPINPWADLSL